MGDVHGSIDRLSAKTKSTKFWHGAIGETLKLREEMGRLGGSGGKVLDDLKRKHDGHVAKLKEAGFQVERLDQDYKRLGRTLDGLNLQARGLERIQQGKTAFRDLRGEAAVGLGMVAGPAKVAADYQAIIRDIGIKAGFDYKEGGNASAQEKQLSDTILKAAADNGMGRDALANAINDLVAGGMDIKEAMGYAATVAKVTVGQKAEGTDVTKMMGALSDTLGIRDAASMARAQEILAYQGKAGKFEFNAMARYLPTLAPAMGNLGLHGEEGVRKLGAALQTMRKGAGTDEEAADNLKNWFSKIGADDTIKNYDKAGIDYQKEMKKLAAAGIDPFEASLEMAKNYIESTDKEGAARMQAAAKELDKIQDGARRKEFLEKLEQTFKTGDLFGDMQAKAALSAYMQNRDDYRKIRDTKDDKGNEAAKGVLDADLSARRAASLQKWSEAADRFNDTLARLGDALRPATDAAADAVSGLGRALTGLIGRFPEATAGATALGVAYLTYRGARAAKDVVGGGMDLLRGKLKARGAGKLPGLLEEATGGGAGLQRVFVVNWPRKLGGSGVDAGMDLPGGDKAKPGAGKPKPTIPDRPGAGTSKPSIPTKPSTAKPGLLGRAWSAMQAGGEKAAKGGRALWGGFNAARTAGSLGAIAGGGGATLAGAASGVLAAGMAGYGVGTLINKKFVEGTSLGDAIGRNIAKTLALFGNKEAQAAVSMEKAAGAAALGRSAAKPPTVSGNQAAQSDQAAALRSKLDTLASAVKTAATHQPNITHAPHITVNVAAGGDAAAAKQAVEHGVRLSAAEFKRHMDDYHRDRNRRSYTGS